MFPNLNSEVRLKFKYLKFFKPNLFCKTNTLDTITMNNSNYLF